MFCVKKSFNHEFHESHLAKNLHIIRVIRG